MSAERDRSDPRTRNDPISEPRRMRLLSELVNVEVTDPQPSVALPVIAALSPGALTGVRVGVLGTPSVLPTVDVIRGVDGAVLVPDRERLKALGGGARGNESEVWRIPV